MFPMKSRKKIHLKGIVMEYFAITITWTCNFNCSLLTSECNCRSQSRFAFNFNFIAITFWNCIAITITLPSCYRAVMYWETMWFPFLPNNCQIVRFWFDAGSVTTTSYAVEAASRSVDFVGAFIINLGNLRVTIRCEDEKLFELCKIHHDFTSCLKNMLAPINRTDVNFKTGSPLRIWSLTSPDDQLQQIEPPAVLTRL